MRSQTEEIWAKVMTILIWSSLKNPAFPIPHLFWMLTQWNKNVLFYKEGRKKERRKKEREREGERERERERERKKERKKERKTLDNVWL